MIRTLRALFLIRPTREKILLLAFLIAIAAVWLSSLSTRVGQFIAESRHTSLELHTQAMWLANSERIEKNAEAQAAQFDSTKTLDGPRLLTALSNLGSEAGLTFQTAVDDRLSADGRSGVHTVQFNVTRASWLNLCTFYTKLQERFPFISLEQFSIVAPPGSPGMLNAGMKISSVEIIRH